MKSPLTEFCDELGIPENLKNAFSAYLRTEYAKRFFLAQDGDTIHLMIGRLTHEQLQDAWQMFVKEMAKYLLGK
jgi:hypothetical protein